MFDLTNYKSALFDFDGVLGDTMIDNYLAWKYAFSNCGFELDKDSYFLLEGLKPSAVVEHFLKKDHLKSTDVMTIVKNKERYYRENNQFKFYPNALELLERLKSNGIQLGLVTGAGRERLLATGIFSKLEPFFSVFVTADDVDKGKPFPDPYLKGLELLKSSAAHTFVVENAPLGIESAKKANLKCVAICSTLDESNLNGADYIFETIKNFLDSLVLENQL